MHHIRLKNTESNRTFLSFLSFHVEVNIRCSYQYVSFEEQTGLNGDTDAGLTVSLDITANIRQRNVLNTTNNTTHKQFFGEILHEWSMHGTLHVQ